MKKVILTAFAVLCLCSCGHPKPNDASADNPVAQSTAKKSPVSAVVVASPLEMAKAFVVAFGQPAPAEVTITSDPSAPGTSEVYDFNPESLFQISPGLFVLVSDGVNQETCHACTGHLAIHYLTLDNGEYKTLGRWLDVGGEAPYGQTAKWIIRHDVEPNPVIWTTNEDGGQGCDMTSHDIISLLPARAVTSAQGIITEVTYDGGGGDDGGKPWKTEGQFVPGADKQSFSVIYSGKYNKTDRYEKYQDKYMQDQVDDPSGLTC